MALTTVTIDGFPIDVASAEDHDLQTDVTDYPVEEGGDITDHARNKPDTVTLECIVSDTPLGQLATFRGLESSLPSDDAYARLKAIRAAKEPVTITTSLGIYTSMMLTSLGIPRRPDNGDALRFKVTFKQVVIVTNARTTTRVAVPRAKNKKPRGNKPSTATTTDPSKIKNPITVRRSLAKRGANAVGDFLGGL